MRCLYLVPSTISYPTNGTFIKFGKNLTDLQINEEKRNYNILYQRIFLFKQNIG